MPEQHDDPFTFRLEWVGADLDGVKMQPANQFAFLHNPDADEVIFHVGQLIPPLLLGDNDERRAQALALGSTLPVKTLARFVLTRTSALKLRQVIDEHVAGLSASEEDDLA